MKWDRVLSIVLTVLTIAGALWMAYAKPAQWDQAVKDVAELKPTVDMHGKLLASNEAHYEDLVRRLDRIDRKLDD